MLVPLSQELDYKKELAEARDEKYGRTQTMEIRRQFDSENEGETTGTGEAVPFV